MTTLEFMWWRTKRMLMEEMGIEDPPDHESIELKAISRARREKDMSRAEAYRVALVAAGSS